MTLPRRRSVALLLFLLSACAPLRPAVAPAANAPVRLDAADALLSAGCLDCLLEGYRSFDDLRANPAVGDRATASAIRAAALIALRESELGLVDSGYLQRAKQLLAASRSPASDLGPLIEIADVLVAGPAGQTPFATSEAQTQALIRQSANQAGWASFLRLHMPGDYAATYIWLSLACGIYGTQIPGGSDRAVVVGSALRTPLIAFKDATACTRGRADLIKPLVEADPRFGEAHYFLGLAALAGQTQPGVAVGTPDVDLADREFRAAYEWRQAWPSLTLLIGNTALTAEDFSRAIEFYDKTLALAAAHPDALLGKIRALTYMQRYGGAIGVANQLLATGSNTGEARYWRALNEEQFGQPEEAWSDVEIANGLLRNADVPKLAGIIAIGRRDLPVARQRLELALMRRPNDCETGHYLQIVLSEQREWQRAVQATQATASCFDAEESILHAQIEALRASTASPERRDRQIARRERQIATNARMRATAWFNAAAANFNLGKKEDAREFADRLTSDEQFGARARELIEKLAIRN